jgi:hypothetical protein
MAKLRMVSSRGGNAHYCFHSQVRSSWMKIREIGMMCDRERGLLVLVK